ncbi:MAG: HEAT repeat domain-containing protein, partial [Candidatus Omnitrophota bacterium]
EADSATVDQSWDARIAAVNALEKIGQVAIPGLIKALGHENVFIRGHSAQAISFIAGTDPDEDLILAVPPLILMAEDKHPFARTAAVMALASLTSIGGKEVFQALMRASDDKDPTVASIATGGWGEDVARGLEKSGSLVEGGTVSVRFSSDAAERLYKLKQALLKTFDPSVIPVLVEGLSDEYRSIRSLAADALARIAGEHPDANFTPAVEPLVRNLKDEDMNARRAAVQALGKIGALEAVAPLAEVLQADEARVVRQAVVVALGQIKSPQAVDALIQALKDESPYVREEAARALGEIGDKRATKPLIKVLQDEDPDVREAACEALGKIGDSRAIEPLAAALEDEFPTVHQAARRALNMLGDPRGAEAFGGIIPAIELSYLKELFITSPQNFAQATAQKVAATIRELLEKQEQVTIVFATGNTMIEFLHNLALEDGIEWERVQAFHLDEYKGLAPEDEHSFAHFLNRYLFSGLLAKGSIPEGNIHYINGASPDLEGYMQKLKSFGGADIVLLGVGMDGHLAFNEPPKYSSFTSRMQEVELTESTIEANTPDCPDIRKNPYAYTMGMADIFEGKHLFFFANGAKKARIVREALKGMITRGVPASVLQLHPNVTVILDEKAASMLTGEGIVLYGSDGIKAEVVNKSPLPSKTRVLVLEAEPQQHLPFAGNLVRALKDKRLRNKVEVLLVKEGLDLSLELMRRRPEFVIAPANYPFIEETLKLYGRLFGVNILYYDPLLKETELNCFVSFDEEEDLEGRTIPALSCHETQTRRTDYIGVTRNLCLYAGRLAQYLGWSIVGKGKPCANPFIVARINEEGELVYQKDKRFQVLAEGEIPQDGFEAIRVGPATIAFIGSPHPDDDVITDSGLSIKLLRLGAKVVNMVMYLCKYGVSTEDDEVKKMWKAAGLTEEERGELRRPEVLAAGARLGEGLPGIFEVEILEDLRILDKDPGELAKFIQDEENPEYIEMFDEAVEKILDYLRECFQSHPGREIVFIAPHHEDSHPGHRVANAVYVEAIKRFCKEQELKDVLV